MMKTIIGFIAVMIVAAGLCLGLSPDLSAQDLDGKALFEKKCSACHALDRPRSHHESDQGWEKIVSSMRRKASLDSSKSFTKEEADAITRYLAENQGK